jgi:hypothetical protein
VIADKLFSDAIAFSKHLAKLHDRRRKRVKGREKSRRPRLSVADRAEVLRSTGARCHICGGLIGPDGRWTADHVLPHAQGGRGGVENHLPAHGLCNNYRWHYSAEELQWILKIGVWTRSQIETGDALALQLAERFVAHEHRRAARRKGGDGAS